MVNAILYLMGLTLLPFLELRSSIPYGIFKTDLHWATIFFICVATNIALTFFVWFFIHHIMFLFLKIGFINNIYKKIVDRSQKKVKPYVESYGKLGLALFIGIPLPGSGVYSGALGAYLLGYKFKDYLIAAIIGVLIAGVAVTLISIFGNGALNFFIKTI